jgi:hypothetical protein
MKHFSATLHPRPSKFPTYVPMNSQNPPKQPSTPDVEHPLVYDLRAEAGRFFDDASRSHEAPPRFVCLMGCPAGGKTTFRRAYLSSGFVLVDAAEVFRNLSRGIVFDFPGPFAEIMESIGQKIALRAILEQRHIVTEVIGSDFEATMPLLDAMEAAGYWVELYHITCSLEQAQERNLRRADGTVSACYAEAYHRAWLIAAAKLSQACQISAPNGN